ncbi:MAG TPA: type I methionyl aminopeptidase [Spirochaetota bacterium]|nr:type I methionyl aminopeptidase [Spirochaetota bacterium]
MRDVRLKSADDIERIREAGGIIAGIFAEISGETLVDRSTLEVDRFIEERIHRYKARPSFKTIRKYDYSSCISLNNEIVHGIPSKNKIVRAGDLVKIDIGVVKNGYFADRCVTFLVEPVAERAALLARTAEEALARAIPLLCAGNRLGDVGAAIQSLAESRGFRVVRDFTGHGVGFAVHEQPIVPHFGRKGTGRVIEEGMVLAIEPILNEGAPDVLSLRDGWTVVTADGRLSAQFEHTVAVTSKGPVVLTA